MPLKQMDREAVVAARELVMSLPRHGQPKPIAADDIQADMEGLFVRRVGARSDATLQLHPGDWGQFAGARVGCPIEDVPTDRRYWIVILRQQGVQPDGTCPLDPRDTTVLGYEAYETLEELTENWNWD